LDQAEEVSLDPAVEQLEVDAGRRVQLLGIDGLEILQRAPDPRFLRADRLGRPVLEGVVKLVKAPRGREGGVIGVEPLDVRAGEIFEVGHLLRVRPGRAAEREGETNGKRSVHPRHEMPPEGSADRGTLPRWRPKIICAAVASKRMPKRRVSVGAFVWWARSAPASAPIAPPARSMGRP